MDRSINKTTDFIEDTLGSVWEPNNTNSNPFGLPVRQDALSKKSMLQRRTDAISLHSA
jgi:hypothetical protein